MWTFFVPGIIAAFLKFSADLFRIRKRDSVGVKTQKVFLKFEYCFQEVTVDDFWRPLPDSKGCNIRRGHYCAGAKQF